MQTSHLDKLLLFARILSVLDSSVDLHPCDTSTSGSDIPIALWK